MSGERHFADLPREAQRFMLRLQELLGVSVDLVSVGPEGEQAIQVRPIS